MSATGTSLMLPRELIEQELERRKERPNVQERQPYTDRDRKLVSAYRSFVRYNIIHYKRGLILDDNTFNTLAKYLCEIPRLSYQQFKIIASMVPETAKKYFTAKIFLSFPRDAADQSIKSEDFVRYIERSIDVEQIIWNLMDTIPPGADPMLTYITEQQLEAFLLRMIPEIDVYQEMHESFHEYYVYTSSQKFLFFLDIRKTNMISIKKLAHSSVMEELLTLRRSLMNADEIGRQELEIQMSTNWFGEGNAARLYSLFLELDADQSGMLDIDEIVYFEGTEQQRVSFTRTAWQRIYDENITYQSFELDYKGFVNVVLAVENMNTPAGIKYFWKVLDYDRTGYLTATKIKYFFQDVYDALMERNYEPPCIEHVVVEIFDILGTSDAESGATLQDMMQSKQGHTVISMLLDVNGFWRYDNRESLIMSDGEDHNSHEDYHLEGTVENAYALDTVTEEENEDEYVDQLAESLATKNQPNNTQSLVYSDSFDDEF